MGKIAFTSHKSFSCLCSYLSCSFFLLSFLPLLSLSLSVSLSLLSIQSLLSFGKVFFNRVKIVGNCQLGKPNFPPSQVKNGCNLDKRWHTKIFRIIAPATTLKFYFVITMQCGHQAKNEIWPGLLTGGSYWPKTNTSELHFARSFQGHPTWP